MKRLSLLLLLSLILVSCSSETQVEKDPEVPESIKNYFRASAESDWKTVCDLLGTSEIIRIEKGINKGCPLALESVGPKLSKAASSASIKKLEKVSGVWRVETTNPPGEIWMKNDKIYFSRP